MAVLLDLPTELAVHVLEAWVTNLRDFSSMDVAFSGETRREWLRLVSQATPSTEWFQGSSLELLTWFGDIAGGRTFPHVKAVQLIASTGIRQQCVHSMLNAFPSLKHLELMEGYPSEENQCSGVMPDLLSSALVKAVTTAPNLSLQGLSLRGSASILPTVVGPAVIRFASTLRWLNLTIPITDAHLRRIGPECVLLEDVHLCINCVTTLGLVEFLIANAAHLKTVTMIGAVELLAEVSDELLECVSNVPFEGLVELVVEAEGLGRLDTYAGATWVAVAGALRLHPRLEVFRCGFSRYVIEGDTCEFELDVVLNDSAADFFSFLAAHPIPIRGLIMFGVSTTASCWHSAGETTTGAAALDAFLRVHSPSLRSLGISMESQDSDEVHSPLCFPMLQLLSGCPLIESFNVELSEFDDVDVQTCFSAPADVPSNNALASITVVCTSPVDQYLTPLWRQAPNLKELTMCTRHALSHETMDLLRENCKNLRSVRCDGQWFTDKELEAFAAQGLNVVQDM